MEKKLQKQFDAMENQRHQLLRQMEICTASSLNWKAKSNGWSANQTVQHLLLAETLSCKSIKAKLIKGNFERAGFMARLRELLVKIYLRSSKPFKAPTAVSSFPEQLEFAALKQNWDAVRAELKELLDSVPQHLLNHYLFLHPVAGKMTISGALVFMQEHVRRHAQQINQLIEQQK